MTERRYRLAVDIGRTFVDAIAYDEQSREITVRKSPTTPAAPADGVITATRATGAALEEASVYTHGTTLGLNAILERRGSVTGIILIELVREDVLDGYVSREQAEKVYGVRVAADGTAAPVGQRLARPPS